MNTLGRTMADLAAIAFQCLDRRAGLQEQMQLCARRAPRSARPAALQNLARRALIRGFHFVTGLLQSVFQAPAASRSGSCVP